MQRTQVHHIAKLAAIPISDADADRLANEFTTTLGVIEQLSQIDTRNTSTTHQVTGFKNVLREDRVKPQLSFSQEQALANATQTHQGFFVVPYVLQNKDA